MKVKLILKSKEPESSEPKSLKFLLKKKNLRMRSAPYYIPKGHKLKPLGEDAHFVSPDQQTIGVADGVGGWASQGVDAGEYARELMHNSLDCVKKESSVIHPKRVIEEAFSNTKRQGSSTACVMTHNDGVLRAANVGDSGFMVLREGKVVYKSPTQQRRFNCPFQLGHGQKSDRPECAVEMEFRVIAGDIVVMGSDGLLDNLFEWEIEEIIQKEYHKLLKENKDSANKYEDLAYQIAETAYYKSLDKYCMTPFAIACTLAEKKHKGGKMDDITVVVGHIVNDSSWRMSALSSS
ncbi:PPM-type phosphatase domain containing protein [Trema orientale]|uniref:Protein phosphatase n=1 Tax=Trema orientale TaxID=63057 RepID=A0A2P5FL04_TREOI|nr:PPM-type phosphatase domain containing protein [Trema orientale]